MMPLVYRVTICAHSEVEKGTYFIVYLKMTAESVSKENFSIMLVHEDIIPQNS